MRIDRFDELLATPTDVSRIDGTSEEIGGFRRLFKVQYNPNPGAFDRLSRQVLLNQVIRAPSASVST